MTVQTKTRVILNPNTDTDVIEQYEKDRNWKKISEDRYSTVFEYSTPTYYTKSTYFPAVDQ